MRADKNIEQKYFANGKYSPRKSEHVRQETKSHPQSKKRKLTHEERWDMIKAEWAKIDNNEQ